MKSKGAKDSFSEAFCEVSLPKILLRSKLSSTRLMEEVAQGVFWLVGFPQVKGRGGGISGNLKTEQ